MIQPQSSGSKKQRAKNPFRLFSLKLREANLGFFLGGGVILRMTKWCWRTRGEYQRGLRCNICPIKESLEINVILWLQKGKNAHFLLFSLQSFFIVNIPQNMLLWWEGKHFFWFYVPVKVLQALLSLSPPVVLYLALSVSGGRGCCCWDTQTFMESWRMLFAWDAFRCARLCSQLGRT